MAGRKQKIVLEGFSVTIGKLVIEHEFNDAEGLLLAQNVQDALGQALTAPARLLSADAAIPSTPAPVQPAPLPPTPRKRRRRSSASTPSEASPNGETTSRSKAGSPRPLVDELKEEGFFAQDRAIGEVREELHNKGHAFKPNQLSPVLLQMTREKGLTRKKGGKNQWVYRNA